jgi:hypothetical protein
VGGVGGKINIRGCKIPKHAHADRGQREGKAKDLGIRGSHIFSGDIATRVLRGIVIFPKFPDRPGPKRNGAGGKVLLSILRSGPGFLNNVH